MLVVLMAFLLSSTTHLRDLAVNCVHGTVYNSTGICVCDDGWEDGPSEGSEVVKCNKQISSNTTTVLTNSTSSKATNIFSNVLKSVEIFPDIHNWMHRICLFY